MSTPPQPPDDPQGPQKQPTEGGWDQAREQYAYVPVSPVLPEDPPKIGDFWLDARLGATAAGAAFTGHDDAGRVAMVILLSQGAAADAAARDRFAGAINALHIDAVYTRGGRGQDFGRLGRKYAAGDDDPVPPDGETLAPWVALAYDGSPQSAAVAERILDDVQLATLPLQGRPAGPDYRHYWVDRVRPGLTRMWPLPWPGRFDRAGWRTILVSWLLMLLLAALAVLIAILIFRNQPPQAPPPPTGASASPPPQSGSPPPPSGSPPPSSGSPPPSSQSGSPSKSESPSKSGSPSKSPSPSGSGSPSSASPPPSGGGGTPGSASPSGGPSTVSKL